MQDARRLAGNAVITGRNASSFITRINCGLMQERPDLAGSELYPVEATTPGRSRKTALAPRVFKVCPGLRCDVVVRDLETSSLLTCREAL